MKSLLLFKALTLSIVTALPSIVHADDSPPEDTETSAYSETSLPDDEATRKAQQDLKRLSAYLFYAISQGDFFSVKEAIKKGASTNDTLGAREDTALLYAIRLLAELRSRFENKIFTDPNTMTTAYENRIAIIRYVLFHPDTNTSISNKYGETPMSLATQEGLNSILDLLYMKSQQQSMPQTSEAEQYRDQLDELNVSEETSTQIEESIDKLENLQHPAEIGRTHDYLKFLFALPWNTATEDVDDIKKISATLDAEHYGLDKVKGRILDFIALRLLRKQNKQGGEGKNLILCLVGPPGVGKTSLIKSIAQGLGRKFGKISCGGVHDEAAIRGHNKAYLGAEPGNILKEIKKCGANNPVLALDEIDKLGHSVMNGDPASALLEVLDPVQNKEFLDHYLDVPWDLSPVFFVITANNVENIPVTLRDRMEIIHLPSYTTDEKLDIAKRYLVPKALSDAGFSNQNSIPAFSDALLTAIITKYTYEAGVRKLEQRLNILCAKAARHVLEQGSVPEFTVENLTTYLGVGHEFDNVEKQFAGKKRIGFAQGLSWSQVGGSVLVLETSLIPGKGNVKLTGSLHDVMKESAHIALSYVLAHANELGFNAQDAHKYDIHIHAPAGSTPKDGPSAGIAFVSAITSLLTQRPFDPQYAMTGEVSLQGEVLPIGGLKEKLAGAKRLGIKKVIIPQGNVSDLEECKKILDGTLEIIPVTHVQEVLDKVLLPKQ